MTCYLLLPVVNHIVCVFSVKFKTADSLTVFVLCRRQRATNVFRDIFDAINK